jgi:transcriptional regulator with XRE-family HTH domain
MTSHPDDDPEDDRAIRVLIGNRIAEAVAVLGGRVPAANFLGRSPSVISSWSHGHAQPNLVLLRRLALATGFSANYLVGLDVAEPAEVLRPVDERVRTLEVGHRELDDRSQQHADLLLEHQERLVAIEAQLARNALDPARRSEPKPAAPRRTG